LSEPPPRLEKRLIAAVLAALALRLVAAGRLGLAADEAYYWSWSTALDWGYYDHPPAVAGVIAAGCALFGKGELGVRAAGLALQAAAALALLPLGRDRWLLALLLLGSPLLLLGGMLATPDVPLLAAWGLGLAAAARRRWMLFGLVCGAALLSKLTGWLLWPCVLLGMGLEGARDWRLWAAGALAVGVAAPNLAWNATHGWIAYGFQLRHGLVAEAAIPGLAGLGTYLGAQLGLLNPLLAAALALRWLRGPKDLWFWASALPFAAFAAASAVGHSEPNWAAPAYLGAFVALSRSEGRARRLAWWGGWLGAGTSALVLLHALWPLAAVEGDPTHELRMGRPLGEAVAAAVARRPPEGQVVTSRYQEASWIRFYGGVDATTLPGEGRADQHDLWPRTLGSETYYVRRARRLGQTDADAQYEITGERTIVRAEVAGLEVQKWQIFPVRRRDTAEPR
jgi:4-amino-4-deoxy-L-arabinose transferase-like glycosyltransferase